MQLRTYGHKKGHPRPHMLPGELVVYAKGKVRRYSAEVDASIARDIKSGKMKYNKEGRLVRGR